MHSAIVGQGLYTLPALLMLTAKVPIRIDLLTNLETKQGLAA